MRDYVHVTDLVDAHLRGLDWLRAGHGGTVFNLGTGRGFSVAEVLSAMPTAIGREVPHVLGPRRAGDAAALISGSQRAQAELGWQAHHSTLEQMIAKACRWYQTGGYSG